MQVRSTVCFSCTILGVASLLFAPITRANAATGHVDSIVYSHGTNDAITLKGTVTFTSPDHYGGWKIVEDKSGDQVGIGGHIASGSFTQICYWPHPGGSVQYTGTTWVYQLFPNGGESVIPGTTHSATTGSH